MPASSTATYRDVKPSNIFVCASGTIKLLDFGISKVLVEGDGTATEACTRTPFYGAPEQLGADVRDRLPGITRTVQPATDVWGLAITVLELVGGVPPQQYWGARSRAGSVLRLLDPWRPALSDLVRAPLPRGFVVWFLRCIEVDATKRYQTVAAAVTELVGLINGDVDWKPAAPAPLARRRGRRYRIIDDQPSALAAVGGRCRRRLAGERGRTQPAPHRGGHQGVANAAAAGDGTENGRRKAQ